MAPAAARSLPLLLSLPSRARGTRASVTPSACRSASRARRGSTATAPAALRRAPCRVCASHRYRARSRRCGRGRSAHARSAAHQLMRLLVPESSPSARAISTHTHTLPPRAVARGCRGRGGPLRWRGRRLRCLNSRIVFASYLARVRLGAI